MNARLSQEQVANLNRAIDAARGAGRCEYVLAGLPQCVIAHLALLEGVTVGQLERWQIDGGREGDSTVRSVVGMNLGGTERLAAYPLDLLADLQACWDDDSDDELDQREAMRRTVTRWVRQ